MKSRTVTVCEGEYLGPVDWDYDFSQHAWGPNKSGVNPACIEQGKKLLRELTAPGSWLAMTYSVYNEVLRVGMYDGWPFWKPTPYVCVMNTLGPEWHPFYSIVAIKKGTKGSL